MIAARKPAAIVPSPAAARWIGGGDGVPGPAGVLGKPGDEGQRCAGYDQQYERRPATIGDVGQQGSAVVRRRR